MFTKEQIKELNREFDSCSDEVIMDMYVNMVVGYNMGFRGKSPYFDDDFIAWFAMCCQFELQRRQDEI